MLSKPLPMISRVNVDVGFWVGADVEEAWGIGCEDTVTELICGVVAAAAGCGCAVAGGAASAAGPFA
jgi:hypothetical protein